MLVTNGSETSIAVPPADNAEGIDGVHCLLPPHDKTCLLSAPALETVKHRRHVRRLQGDWTVNRFTGSGFVQIGADSLEATDTAGAPRCARIVAMCERCAAV